MRALIVVLAGCGRLGFDAAPGDAVGNDSRDAPAVVCPPNAFCDGFEDPALTVWTGTQTVGGAMVARDAAFGYRGASLHATSPAGSDIAVRSVDVFAVMPAEIWVRAFIYAPSGIVLDLEPIELTDPALGHQLVMSLYDDGSDVHSHGFAGNFSLSGPTVTPRDRWVCYELQVATGPQGTIGLYAEGSALIAAPSFDVQPPNNDLRRVRVGIASKPTAKSEHVFVDEIAVGPARIGCN